MSEQCKECKTGTDGYSAMTGYRWNNERGAEEIIRVIDYQCENCGHEWHTERGGNYRIAGEVLDEQRAKLDLLWEFYEDILGINCIPGTTTEELERLYILRQNAIAVAKERKQEGGA